MMTTILESPYMMLRRPDLEDVPREGNDRFEGYCKVCQFAQVTRVSCIVSLTRKCSKHSKDLADLIAKKTGVNFEIRPVKDGKYGSPDPDSPGGWNGMIGELVRREAEIAVAPLTINSAREKVREHKKKKKWTRTRPILMFLMLPGC